ncbi:carotenoid biosynthesis protein, partial [bacterium]|nr:carotenoid biosynthesis protein [bacterium]
MIVLEVLLHTVAKRPYVFAFLLAFLGVAWPTLGRARTLLFLVVGYMVAFLSELSSIRNGFPYGVYWYEYSALDPLELVVGGRPPEGAPLHAAAGVPFFDSLSYAFMAYASYALALLLTQPLHVRAKWDLQLADTPLTRARATTWLTGAFLMGLLDVIVDPVAFRGDRWFLGKIYGYAEDGAYFHVPLSNFLGWWLVSLVTFFIVAKLDARFVSPDPARSNRGTRRVPLRALLGAGIWFGCAAFNIAIAFSIDDAPLGFAGTYVAAPVLFLAVARSLGAGGRASREQIEAHAL